MTNPIPSALKILAHFWLEELRAADLETVAALPDLAETLPGTASTDLVGLAVEYQRLFGFNLAPYESIFVDPSAMLLAPATERVQRLYRQAGWQPPSEVRSGAPDHLGLELLALASWSEADQGVLARQLHTRHLALWAPPFILTLRRLAPHPFYATLAELTLELLLTTLPDDPLPPGFDPFPDLPEVEPQNSPDLAPLPEDDETDEPSSSPGVGDGKVTATRPPPSLPLRGGGVSNSPHESDDFRLRDLIRRLLPPCRAGLYITREDIARMGQALGSAPGMGDRYRMLDTLFRFAGQYELLPPLFEQLLALLAAADSAYRTLAGEFPAWRPYAAAWRQRLALTQAEIESWQGLVDSSGLD